MDDSFWLVFLQGGINAALILALRQREGAGHCRGGHRMPLQEHEVPRCSEHSDELQPTLSSVSWPSLQDLLLGEP